MNETNLLIQQSRDYRNKSIKEKKEKRPEAYYSENPFYIAFLECTKDKDYYIIKWQYLSDYECKIGKYEVDFKIINTKTKKRIAIEVYGHKYHFQLSRKSGIRHCRRFRQIQKNGWIILPFHASEIRRYPEECVKEVLEFLNE